MKELLTALLVNVLSVPIVASLFDGTFTEGYGVSLYITPEGELHTIGNDWDLNDDGWLDLVVINEFEWQDGEQIHDTYSYVFWGGPQGFERTRCDSFATHGAECAALADFDRDGWTDIVIANSTYDYSCVIYGSKEGYTEARRDSFLARPNHGSISVADLNRDGWLDLVWSNWFGQGGFTRIYWGSEMGFDTTHITYLYTGPTHGNLVADFDGDGYADIFWAVYYKKYDPTRRPSLIYWGGEDGFGPTLRTELASVGPGDDISVGDLNKDGFLDIIIPNHSSEPPPAWTTYDYSYVYYGQGNRQFRLDSLYAPGPWASSVADVDNDDWLDIVFTCSVNDYPLLYRGSPHGFQESEILPVWRVSSVYLADFDNDNRYDIYLGSQEGYSMNLFYQRKEGWEIHSSPMKGVDAGLTHDLGNPHTHTDEAWYLSPPITVTESVDSLAVIEGYSMDVNTTWQGEGLPRGAGVELWVSATPNPEEGNWSEWIKLNPQGPPSVSGRAFRYKLCFKTGMRTSLTLNKVELLLLVRKGGNPLIIQRTGRYFDISLDLSLVEPNQSLNIYDRLGRRVRTLPVNSSGHAYWLGYDNLGRRLPAGVYFLLVRQGNQSSSHKLVLLAE